MQKKFYQFLCLIISSLITLSSCVTSSSQGNFSKQEVIIENSLPKSKLAYYSDSFDTLRDDIWENEAITFREEQISHIKLAEMNIEKGKLKIKTKTGGISKNGLSSKYTLKGDFDIQIDCQIDFLESANDISQQLYFVVHPKKFTSEKDKEACHVIIILRKMPGENSRIFSRYANPDEKVLFRKVRRSGDFQGTLRIVRIGNMFSILYKKDGQLEWTDFHNFRGIEDEVRVAFALQNFNGLRTIYFPAKSSISATFDNFQINAAQEIIEDEI